MTTLTDRQRATVRRLFARSRENGWQVVTFMQDHFYTRDRKFGYPVCIQLQNPVENVVEDSAIVQWSSSKNVCYNVVEAIDALVSELESEVING